MNGLISGSNLGEGIGIGWGLGERGPLGYEGVIFCIF